MGNATGIQDVEVTPLDPNRFEEVLDADAFEEVAAAIEEARSVLEGRVVHNINSTARGGGVAEMLRSLLAYARGADVDARWLVVPGGPEFFRITKRIHNNLHGDPGDGGELGDKEREIYERNADAAAQELRSMVRPDDVVVVHDPQPAALVEPLVDLGATVIWRCHVGLDNANDVARQAWKFLLPYVKPAHSYVFSREGFVWEGLDGDRVTIIPPSIDAFSAKNQELDADTVGSILASTGLVDGETKVSPEFTRWDGSTARVEQRARMLEDSVTPAGAPIVTQVSRWDRLKDPVGVIHGFARYIASRSDAHLIVAGPDVAAVADDPEGAEVLDECTAVREELPEDVRARVHLAALPMEDGEENAAIVNALQRGSTVVVQKSLAEGFGLTVAEAMWKARPVVASRIGGIQDQIEDGETGILVDDPADLEAYGAAVTSMLDEPERAERIGEAAQQSVRSSFLGARHLLQYFELIKELGA